MSEFISHAVNRESIIPESTRLIDQISPEHRIYLCEAAKRTVDLMPELEPTIKSLAELRIFNILAKQPNIDHGDWEREIRQLYKWSDEEHQSAQEDNLLPTIGVEIESPEKFFGPALEEVLDSINIYHYEDQIGGALVKRDELAPKYNYSAHTTSRLIHELSELGAFPLEEREDGHKKVPDDIILGLHVNFGSPSSINREMLQESSYELEKINGLLSIAFASVHRLKNRGQYMVPVGIKIKGAHESSKAQRLKSEDEAYNDEDTGLTRVELRAMEFRKFSVYRMLIEVQELMATYFSYVKQKQELPTTRQGLQLAQIWEAFYQESEALLKQYSPYLEYYSGAIDTRAEEVVELMETTDIQQACRSLITKYSHIISETIEPSVQ